MRLNALFYILLCCSLISCSENYENSEKGTALVEPDVNYVIGLKLKEKLDSSSVYSDSLIAKEINWVREYFDLKRDMILKPIKIDSSSYEILIRPYHFPKLTESFYLVTQDSIYLLESTQYFNAANH